MTTGAEAGARKPFAIFAITKHGIQIAQQLRQELPEADLYVSKKLFAQAPAGARAMALPMGPTLRETFTRYDCHIHIISVGAVFRMLAPLIENKKVDPAVVCVDDAARYAVCLLSGHVGRGNFFTSRVAQILAAEPVITTASDARGTLTVDILGRELGWQLEDMDHNVTRACASVVNQEKTLVVQETGEATFWPPDQPLPPGVEYRTSFDGVDPTDYEILLIVSDRDVARSHPGHYENGVVYRPKSLVLGLGCDKSTPAALIEAGVMHHLNEQGLSFRSVKAIATIDKKKDEAGFLTLSEKYAWPITTYSAEELDAVEGIENPSEVVKKYVGTRTVAEGACMLLAGADRLLVPKRSYTEPGVERNMTIAVARIPFSPRGEARQ